MHRFGLAHPLGLGTPPAGEEMGSDGRREREFRLGPAGPIVTSRPVT